MSVMTMNAESWVGSVLDDLDGRRIGTIEAIYFDEQTSEPQWMVVKTGMFGTRHSFVPLDDARPMQDAIVTSHDKSEIDDAPKIALAEDLPDEQLHELYRYYGLPYDAPFETGRSRIAVESPVDRIMQYLVAS